MKVIETLRFTTRHAWCETCMRLVGQPRVTVREARADLRAHRKAGHPAPRPGETVPARAGRYTVVASTPSTEEETNDA